MTANDILKMMNDTNSNELVFSGNCYDCGDKVTVTISIKDIDTLEYIIEGGAIWIKQEDHKDTTINTFTLKCQHCFEQDNRLHDQECEVFQRVCGYMRPVGQFNVGKKEEFKDRKYYKVAGT